MIETAIGGKNLTQTIEGRERYPVRVRYARDFREDLDALKRVLVPLPMSVERGASERMNASTLSRSSAPTQIPISMLADITYKTGPPSIRNENGQLVGFVFVDITTDDIEGYVRAASQRLGGSTVVEDCPESLKGTIDMWGPPPSGFGVMQRLKEQFDPRGVLNPGRFVGGI